MTLSTKELLDLVEKEFKEELLMIKPIPSDSYETTVEKLTVKLDKWRRFRKELG